jgi:inorganic triphosphatase YgiF
MLEVELKLAVEGSFAPTLPHGRAGVAGIEELAPLDLRATYYDTPDLRMARSGITLRHRTGEGERPGWTLKLPSEAVKSDDTAAGRDELYFEGSPRVVPDDARDLVTAFVRTATLAPVARLRTRRRRWSLRGREGQELAELVDDRVSVLQRGRVVERFREIEIEGRTLDREGLERIAGVLAEDGGATIAPMPKLVRALGDRADAPPDVIVPERLAPSEPAGFAVRAALARGVERIVLNDPRTRLGEVEPLHQMRVGTRRLRSDLRTFRKLVDREWAQELRSELKWLGQVLGAVRDLDVLLQRLRAGAGELEVDLGPLYESLEARREGARAELLAALRSARYVELLDRLVEGARTPALSPAADVTCEKALPPLVARSWRKLARVGRALDADSPDESYHRVRVLAKRARYGAEAVSPAFGSKRGRQALKFARRAADLQDVLGDLQDSVVAHEAILDAARAHPENAAFNLAAGQLAEHQVQARADARAAFPDVWEKLDRSKRLKWLKR